MRGYNGGAWNGSGIVSSTAAGDAAHAVGYALASEVLGSGGGTFLGRQVDGTAVVARYTLAGDTNPDGRVDFVDLVALAQNYNTTNGSATWHGGDLTYDGNVDFTDLVKLAQITTACCRRARARRRFRRDLRRTGMRRWSSRACPNRRPRHCCSLFCCPWPDVGTILAHHPDGEAFL